MEFTDGNVCPYLTFTVKLQIILCAISVLHIWYASINVNYHKIVQSLVNMNFCRLEKVPWTDVNGWSQPGFTTRFQTTTFISKATSIYHNWGGGVLNATAYFHQPMTSPNISVTIPFTSPVKTDVTFFGGLCLVSAIPSYALLTKCESEKQRQISQKLDFDVCEVSYKYLL